MHQANGVRHCFETQTKYVRSPAGREGKERSRGRNSTRNSRASRVAQTHFHAWPQTRGCAERRGSPGDSSGARPGTRSRHGGTLQNGSCCEQVSTPQHPFYIPLPPLVLHLPPRGVASGCRRHAARRPSAPAAWRSRVFSHPRHSSLCREPILMPPDQGRDIRASPVLSVSRHCWQFSRGAAGLVRPATDHLS